jgi:hypothetical protein
MEVTTDVALDLTVLGGPIQPRTVRSEVIALPGIPVTASVRLLMVMLSDDTFEGQPEYRDVVLRGREGRASALNLWIEALQSVSGKQGPEAKSDIERIRRADTRYALAPSDSWALAMGQNIQELLSSDVDELPARLSALLAKYRLQRDRALRHTRR